MKLAVSALLFSALCVSPLAAQTFYGAVLDGAQETPPHAVTGSGGWAKFTFNPDSTLTYEVHTFGLSANAAHIHKGAVGVAGSIIFPLAGGPTTFTGTTAALTVAQETDLANGLYYVNVHTAANPNGEIRGQMLASPRIFGAHLTGSQETPPNSSTATGDGFFTMNADNSITYLVTTTNLVGGNAAHLHSGAFGIAGSIEVPLTGGPTVWSGTSLPISDGQIQDLQTLGWYCNVHTAAKPGGEIRGQVVASGTDLFNSVDAEWAPMLTLTSSGTPSDEGGGGTFTLSVTGGKPGGLALLLVSLGPSASKLNGQPFLVGGGPIIVSSVSLPLNGVGAVSLPVATPVLPVSIDITLQFFGLDTAAANGKFNASSAEEITLQHF